MNSPFPIFAVGDDTNCEGSDDEDDDDDDEVSEDDNDSFERQRANVPKARADQVEGLLEDGSDLARAGLLLYAVFFKKEGGQVASLKKQFDYLFPFSCSRDTAFYLHARLPSHLLPRVRL